MELRFLSSAKLRFGLIALLLLAVSAAYAETLVIYGYGTSDPAKAKNEKTLALMASETAGMDMRVRLINIIKPTTLTWKGNSVSIQSGGSLSMSNITTNSPTTIQIAPFYCVSSVEVNLDAIQGFTEKKVESLSFTYTRDNELDFSVYSPGIGKFLKSVESEINRKLIEDIVVKYPPASNRVVLSGLCISKKIDGNSAAVEIRYVMQTN